MGGFIFYGTQLTTTCYTTAMTRKPEDTTSAAQSWRDRLNAKRTSQQGGHTGAPRGAAAPNMSNRSGNTSPSSTARKAKKGHRPG